ncbi:ABC transporter ATP-binding protein [Mesorhizobium sp. CAU 1741]|uniref:ABC transporter ATP-binding protein n=1 Tax=Mesorhizobium sp. CAU 1741 TaxID=3140366 RepID=UPI00325B4308
MSSVSIRDVRRDYGSFVAVDGISLTVESGEFVTLLGPSGCGKTTTLRMIAGLEKNTGGTIRIGETLVSDASANLFLAPERRKLGMVFQSYAIWPHMSVFDNVAYPLRIRRRSGGEIDDRVRQALRMVEMEAFADRPAPALSGGQQQRVAIARALVFEPEVLLLDEPLSNLDARLRTQMGDEFRQLQQRLGITTIYVTHDQSEAMALSDRIVVMKSGNILQIGAPESIYHRPLSREVATFFGDPNLIEADVRDCRQLSADVFALDVEGPGWSGECRAAVAVSSGSKVTIVVRPESLRVGDAAGEGPALEWTGTVSQSIFRGSHRSIVIDTPGHSLNAETSSLANPSIGNQVTVSAPAAAVWALAAG